MLLYKLSLCVCVFPKGQTGHACFIHSACGLGLQQKHMQSDSQYLSVAITQYSLEVGVVVSQFIEQLKSLSTITFASVSHFRNANTTPTVVPGVDLLGMNVGGISTSLKNMHSFFPVN